MILARDLRKNTDPSWFKNSGDMRLPTSALPLAQFLDMTPGTLMAIAGMHKVYHWIISRYLREAQVQEREPHDYISGVMGTTSLEKLLRARVYAFPSTPLYLGELELSEAVESLRSPTGVLDSPFWDTLLQDIFYKNPALEAHRALFNNRELVNTGLYAPFQQSLARFLAGLRPKGTFEAFVDEKGQPLSLIELLLMPVRRHPSSLMEQLGYVQKNWGHLVDKLLLDSIMQAEDVLKEEIYAPRTGVGAAGAGTAGTAGGSGQVQLPALGSLEDHYEAFSEDKHWMPRVVMIAKNALVWLHQLREKYKAPIYHLDQIPDEELDQLAAWGFTGLWLIGLWERSEASQRIKQICGNPEAAASAYSLKGYHIAHNLGGEAALEGLKARCTERGIRLGSDMVPNHTGLDAYWLKEHPEYYLQLGYSPYPNYSFRGENLSRDWDLEVRIEDHYFDQSDAAVVFEYKDHRNGQTRYIYHGNDGTTMPWNDTAQLDYSNPATREAVIQAILHVARNFPIIRFDAAMTLAKKHVRRLWFPAPGDGGAIASRAMHSMSDEEFQERVPNEFWREVVDRVAAEVPDCLLLAEAFWMMEGYFVRTLGMHRVYNSAFMHMLKNEDNEKFRGMIKETLEFDPGILQRYVNFMSNPDEETALEQFGDGDKYFAVATVLATLPGLPMIAHGQMEGFKEKYGMEYQRSYWDESPNAALIAEHERVICPLFKARRHFAGAEHFALYDFHTSIGVAPDVYIYTNALGESRSLTVVNNSYTTYCGSVYTSAPVRDKATDTLATTHIADALGAQEGGTGYIRYRALHDGAYYLIPEREVRENGLYLEIGGFKSIVAWDLVRVEGHIYDELWAEFGRGAIADINIAHAKLALRRSRDLLARLDAADIASFIALCQQSSRKKAQVPAALLQSFEEIASQLRGLCVEDMKLADSSCRWAETKAYIETIAEVLASSRKSIQGLRAVMELNPGLISLALVGAFVAPYMRELPVEYAVYFMSEELYEKLQMAEEFGYDYAAGLMAVFAKTPLVAFSNIASDTASDTTSGTALASQSTDAQGEVGISSVSSVAKELDAQKQLEQVLTLPLAESLMQVHWSEGVQYYRKENFYGFVWVVALGAIIKTPEARDRIVKLFEKWCVRETESRWQWPGLFRRL